MSDDLHALLARASTEIEGVAPSLDGSRLALVRSAAHRRRVARRTRESFGGIAVVAVLGAGVWFGLGQQAPAPVVPVVTPTVTPSPTTTPAPTPSPTGPPARADSIDDATVLDRLAHPRTGESWLTPTPAPELTPLLLPDDETGTVLLVGTRGGASIYVTVAQTEFWYDVPVTGLFEVDAAGARLIACPSARSGDPCADRLAVHGSGVVRDESTFYDSLTLPQRIALDDGYTVSTASTRLRASGSSIYGRVLTGDTVATEPVRPLGALGVVALTSDSWLPGSLGLTNLSYAVETPFGSHIWLSAADLPGGDLESVRWDDGVVRAGPPSWEGPYESVSPADGACGPGMVFAREADHVSAQWQPGGTTTEGHRVYVPADGGNEISRAVRAWQEEVSGTIDEESGAPLNGADAGYPFLTDADFLAADALYAIQGPGDEWLLGMRPEALQIVWECA
ncbi:hypothetical protein [Cellulomonas sp.]|uniref:hypothetical protein n=1 Tax=Cellulomonas sp. TaxID=40001 RepID=UPI003BA9693C